MIRRTDSGFVTKIADQMAHVDEEIGYKVSPAHIICLSPPFVDPASINPMLWTIGFGCFDEGL
jgi:hypothetical protein